MMPRVRSLGLAGIVALTGCTQGDAPLGLEQQEPTSLNHMSYEQKLRNAVTISIEEQVINFGKDYDIFVKGEKVATVSGKNVRFFGGDVFTLKCEDGKVLSHEKEHKRFLSLNRAASCYDGNGNLTGYIGEEQIRDLFSFSYVFHFYDAEKNEIGTSRKLGKAEFNSHKLYDNEGNADYDIDKRLTFGGDKFTLKVLDFESSIPLEYAIFITCIEDAISDKH